MDPSSLKPGDHHHRAYVGPPGQYDFMGATQFRLLTTLGLRSRHSLLDLGCGSLRAGRLFIGYLDAGMYHGIEPNQWLVEDGIENELGRDLVALKAPRFDDNPRFDTSVFSRRFDFILAQSIFSHSGRDLVRTALGNARRSLEPEGVLVATFVEGSEDFAGTGWVYPDCVRFRPETIEGFAEDAGLLVSRLPWYHPRQTWYLFATDARRIPDAAMMRHLSGAVLFDPEFEESRAVSRGPVARESPPPGLGRDRPLRDRLLRWFSARSRS